MENNNSKTPPTSDLNPKENPFEYEVKSKKSDISHHSRNRVQSVGKYLDEIQASIGRLAKTKKL